MNFNYIRIIFLFSLIGWVGCQQGADVKLSSNTASVEVSGTSYCDSSSQSQSLSKSEILGADQLASGKTAELSLSPNVSCAEASQATWKIANVVIGQGAKAEAMINGTGVYMISVSTENQKAPSSLKQTESVSQSTSSGTSVRVGVTDSQVLLVGPQVGFELNRYTFSLAVPTGVVLQTVDWNFNDGTPLEHSLTSVSHSFSAGVHSLTVKVVDSNQQVTNLQQSITILSLSSGVDCPVDGVDIVGPTQVAMGKAASYSLSSVSCFDKIGAQYIWNFGDGTANVATSSAQHTFDKAGNFVVTASIRLKGSSTNLFTISRTVNVVDTLETIPGPVTPDPVDPNSCPNLGDTRTIQGDLVVKNEACGVDGTQSNSYRDQIVQVCTKVNNQLLWSTQSTTSTLVSRGACQNQSCVVNTDSASTVIKNGDSRVFYSNSSPVGSCSSVQETRVCQNGVLSGSSTANLTTCQSGCGDFGVHGTVQVGVVTGEISQPVSCRFNEENIFNLFNQISDKTCQNGQVVVSNTRTGSLKSEGHCPVYAWSASDQWTTCSDNCGGSQNLIYSCKNDQGAVSVNERCDGVAPVQTRVCDGNPDAVRSTSVSTRDEEVGSSAICPKNQIGVIVQDRTVTITTTMACIDHRVQQESQVESPSAWVTNSYCRDFVAMRCSQDSLSNQLAAGRYDWMVKCQNSVPQIKEFLDKLANTTYNGIGLDNTTRHLYPTFLDSRTNKPWIAPTSLNGSCNVPSTAYVAAVCVSSCATPEQQIMVEVKERQKHQAMNFIDALVAKVPQVATLQSDSSLRSKKLTSTAVEQWVTELLDTTQPILTFKMKSGGELRVTKNHPLLSQDGSMKVASDFKVGEAMMKLGGEPDQIISIVQSDYYGKVYNLFVKSNDLKRNIVVINGYLSGTAFYQNEGASNMNRVLLRSNLTQGVFSK